MVENTARSRPSQGPSGRGEYEEYHPYGTTAWWAEDSAIQVSRKRYRYTGKEKDEETGLYYHGHRFYAPWLGRWERPDPIGLGDGGNRWGYVGGNPIGARDSTGLGEAGAEDQARRAEGTRVGLEAAEQIDALLEGPGASDLQVPARDIERLTYASTALRLAAQNERIVVYESVEAFEADQATQALNESEVRDPLGEKREIKTGAYHDPATTDIVAPPNTELKTFAHEGWHRALELITPGNISARYQTNSAGQVEGKEALRFVLDKTYDEYSAARVETVVEALADYDAYMERNPPPEIAAYAKEHAQASLTEDAILKAALSHASVQMNLTTLDSILAQATIRVPGFEPTRLTDAERESVILGVGVILSEDRVPTPDDVIALAEAQVRARQ